MEFTFPVLTNINRSGTIKKKIKKLKQQGIHVEIKDNKVQIDKNDKDARKFFEGQIKKYEISLRHEQLSSKPSQSIISTSQPIPHPGLPSVYQSWSQPMVQNGYIPNQPRNYAPSMAGSQYGGNSHQMQYNHYSGSQMGDNQRQQPMSQGGLISMVKGKDLDHSRIYNDMKLSNIEKIRDDHRRDSGLLGYKKVRGAVVSIPQKQQSPTNQQAIHPSRSPNISPQRVLNNRASFISDNNFSYIEDPRRNFMYSDEEPNSPTSIVSLETPNPRIAAIPNRHTMSFDQEQVKMQLIAMQDVTNKKKKKNKKKKEKSKSAIQSYYTSDDSDSKTKKKPKKKRKDSHTEPQIIQNDPQSPPPLISFSPTLPVFEATLTTKSAELQSANLVEQKPVEEVKEIENLESQNEQQELKIEPIQHEDPILTVDFDQTMDFASTLVSPSKVDSQSSSLSREELRMQDILNKDNAQLKELDIQQHVQNAFAIASPEMHEVVPVIEENEAFEMPEIGITMNRSDNEPSGLKRQSVSNKRVRQKQSLIDIIDDKDATSQKRKSFMPYIPGSGMEYVEKPKQSKIKTWLSKLFK